MTPTMCIALAVFFEAREYHETNRQALEAVAAVVQNRVEDSRWPDDACLVVYQHRQFAWTADGLSDHPGDYPEPDDRAAWIVAKQVAADEVAGRGLEITSTHFHDTSETPWWTDHMAFDGPLGSLRFFTDE